MSKLNKSPKPIHTAEGGRAKRINVKQLLERTVLSCLLWEREFYEGGVSIADRISEVVKMNKVEDVATIAIKARSEYHLRHVPLLIVCEMTKHFNGRIVGDTIYEVIQRADELTEILAIYWRNGRCPLSAQMKQGLARAWNKFNAYQLAKYDRDGEVKLRDSLFLCHAKVKDKVITSVIWEQLIAGKLPVPDTWETNLSSGKDKGETFTRLLQENKLGEMAILKNLRNMKEAGVDKELVYPRLCNRIKHSKILPFRYLAAARAVPQWEDMIDYAMQLSMEHMPPLPGKTVLLVDHSESMRSGLSERSTLSRFDTACALAILLRGICQEVEIHTFAKDMTDQYHYHRHGYTEANGYKLLATVPPRSGMALADAMKDSMAWGGTQLGAALRKVDTGNYERLIVITDEQSEDKVPNPKGLGYLINVASNKNGVGYGPWVHVDGFSEAVVRFIQEYENLQDVLIR